MAESKFIDNQDEDIETAILFPKGTSIKKEPEDASIVNRKRSIWKLVFVGALIFLSGFAGFAAPIVIGKLRRHFHRCGKFGKFGPRDHPRDHPHEPDEMMKMHMKMHEDKYFYNEKMKGPGGMKPRDHPHEPDEMMKMHKDKYFDDELMKGPGGMKPRDHPYEPDEVMKMHPGDDYIEINNDNMNEEEPEAFLEYVIMEPVPEMEEEEPFSPKIDIDPKDVNIKINNDNMNEEEPEAFLEYVIMDPQEEMEEEEPFSPRIDIDPKDVYIEINNDNMNEEEPEAFIQEESP